MAVTPHFIKALTIRCLCYCIILVTAYIVSTIDVAQASEDDAASTTRPEPEAVYQQAEKRFETAKRKPAVKAIEADYQNAQDPAAKINRQTTELSTIREEVSSTETIEDRPIFKRPKENKMFARYSRTETAGKETFQEYDTDLSVKAGADERIYLHSGEVVFSENDLNLPDRAGIGFTFTRTYRSQIKYQGPLGRNWDHKP